MRVNLKIMYKTLKLLVLSDDQRHDLLRKHVGAIKRDTSLKRFITGEQVYLVRYILFFFPTRRPLT